MPNLYQAFSLRQFAGGLVFFLIGSFYLLSLLTGFVASWNHKIYIVPILVSPVFLGVGLWMMIKSVQTPFCEQCRTELITKTDIYSLENESQILALVQGKTSRHDSSINFANKDTASKLTVDLTYCPACVSVGTIKITRTTPEEKSVLVKEVLQGPIIAEIIKKIYL